MADRPVLDIHPLDARPAFPEAEITGRDLRSIAALQQRLVEAHHPLALRGGGPEA